MILGMLLAVNQLAAAFLPDLTTEPKIFKAIRSGDEARVSRLIAAGKFTKMNADEMTALHLAASLGDVTSLEKLVAARISLDDLDVSNQTALHYAAEAGHEAAVVFLIGQGISLDDQNNKGKTALHLAADFGHLEVAVELLKAGASQVLQTRTERNTPLHTACEKGYAAIVDTLLKYPGAAESLNCVNQDGETPLFVAVRRGPADSINLILSFNAALANRTNRSGETPLFVAAYYGREAAVRALLDAGADKTTKNRRSQTARDIAAIRGFASIVAMLDEESAAAAGAASAAPIRVEPVKIITMPAEEDSEEEASDIEKKSPDTPWRPALVRSKSAP